MSPREIVEGVESGHPIAEGALYAIFAGGVLRRCRKRSSAEDAEDLAHDVFLKVLCALRAARIRQPDRLMGFIDTAVRNAVRERFRRKAVCSLDFDVADRDDSPPDRRIHQERMSAWLRESLFRLRPVEREALVRYYLEEQSQAEICGATGWSPGRFRSLKYRAIEKLRALSSPGLAVAA